MGVAGSPPGWAGVVTIPEGAFGLEIFDAQFQGAAMVAALATFALLAVPLLWWLLSSDPAGSLLHGPGGHVLHSDRLDLLTLGDHEHLAAIHQHRLDHLGALLRARDLRCG